ncbi:MAG: bifunctional phosphoribosylaminoimidazolecarboxamide formyltransferase/IMP cyclohydrolase [Thermoplasmata archaeon]|nr:bifunctional phosphoribosylaminoimidazolecarboxamide formyltransferase/IMP cyclohydrolase [Thermoplasmata archaeon]
MSGGDGVRVTRALISVFDPAGIGEFALGLHERSIEIWATSGTRQHLAGAGVPAASTEEITGIGDWFGGRIKTLHPALLGGILAPRTPNGIGELERRSLKPIDLVAVNFYPFARRFAEAPDAEDLEESIDIGGVTLARAAAKNHAGVVVASDPSEYPVLLQELAVGGGRISALTRRRLAAAAFARCAAYDALIAHALEGDRTPARPFPESLRLRRDDLALRYGENPHQSAAAYRWEGAGASPLPAWPLELVRGDRLSYTNLLDLDTAYRTVAEFPAPTAAVVKHATPCGVASGATIGEAVTAAVAADPVARYGCVLAVNRPMDDASVAALAGIFVDLAVAPGFLDSARDRLEKRPKLKIVRAPVPLLGDPFWEVHSAGGRILVQEGDRRELTSAELRHVAGPAIDAPTARALDFAWRVVRHAKSNAVVVAKGAATVGIGAGQTTRVKAVELACEVAGDRAKGAVLASDAFFPFADGVEVAGRAGVRAILQPGGSLRDPEVLAAAERFGISMCLTGWRVFRH